ncbi:MAG: flagellar filament capping protein FliD [Kluyvera sp.]
MGISSLGVGTGGIDTASMLEKLKAAEQTRLNPFTNRQKSFNAKVSTWGGISSALSSLQTVVKKLSSEAFNTLNISENKNFTATASAGALADVHSVTVEQLATAHKLKTGLESDADTDLGSTTGGKRTLTITQNLKDSDGNNKKLTVELDDDQTSLNDIAKAINKQNSTVSASVQRTDAGYQLVLSSKVTGSDGEMTVKVDGDSQLANVLDTNQGGDPSKGDNMTSVSAAQNSIVKVDGDTYTRSSNNISDIITGVTLKLTSVTPKDSVSGVQESEQLTLTPDTSAIKTTLQDFVKQYNELLSKTTAASKYVPNDTSKLKDEDVATQSSDSGALMGDAMLRGMMSEIGSVVNGVYGDSGADYGSLADLGIKIDASTGQMTLDTDKLDAAIADNPDEIANMFMAHGDSPGLASGLNDIITEYAGEKNSKDGGLIKSTTDALSEQVKQVGTQIERTQKLIDAQVERYRVQFQNLDTAMSKMNNMSSQLLSLLSK